MAQMVSFFKKLISLFLNYMKLNFFCFNILGSYSFVFI
jgi:hypothetical protein